MDIALNITAAPHSKRAKECKPPVVPKHSRRKDHGLKSNGFNFQFTKSGQKVKAIVARKRPIDRSFASAVVSKSTTTSIVAPAFKSHDKNVLLEAASESKIPKVFNPFTTVKTKNVSADKETKNQKNLNDVKTKSGSVVQNVKESLETNQTNLQNDNNLALNICTIGKSVKGWKPACKSQLSWLERKRQKSLKKAERPALERQEILEGLRKFARNQNKRPEPRKFDNAEIRDNERKNETTHHNVPAPILENGQSDEVARKEMRMQPPKRVNAFKNNPEVGQRLVKPIKESIFNGTKVESLNLHPHSVKNLADLLSITELTTIQVKAIPKVLEGKDLLVRSQTGSGKTLAYALPLVEKLQEIRPKINREMGVMAIVIVPTRELAIQTYELLQKLVKPFTWLVPGILTGGEKRKSEKARLRKGINILVGTPGRLVDHLLHTVTFKLGRTRFLVLDEADRLLELGYERDVQQVVEAIEEHRQEQESELESNAIKPMLGQLQRVLLSATLTAAVQKLASLTLKAPLFIDNRDKEPSIAITNGSAVGYTKETIEANCRNAMNSDDDDDNDGTLTIPENLKL